MTLPPLTIPSIPLPFEIPAMIHPVFAHFAIALPVVVLILELINLFAKKRTVGVLSFFFMVMIAVVFLSAYLTGGVDGKMAKEFLSAEAKEALSAHKQLGIYLVYSSGILMLFKLFSVLIRKTAIRVLFFLVLIVFTAAVFNEGKKGGALVYQYGVNVKSVPAIGAQTAEPKHEAAATEPAAHEAAAAETAPAATNEAPAAADEAPAAAAPQEAAHEAAAPVHETTTHEAAAPEEGNVTH